MGHAVGDKILIAMGTCLRAAFRTDDKVFRVGGEEFLILSAGITIEALHERIANLRRAVALAGRISLPADMPLTFSAGVGIWPEDAINFGDLWDIVDKRLYCAKKSGRNCTVGPQNSCFTAPSINNTVVPLVGVR
jgi:diguanylate cyclase (GGDEF)-like protein